MTKRCLGLCVAISGFFLLIGAQPLRAAESLQDSSQPQESDAATKKLQRLKESVSIYCQSGAFDAAVKADEELIELLKAHKESKRVIADATLSTEEHRVAARAPVSLQAELALFYVNLRLAQSFLILNDLDHAEIAARKCILIAEKSAGPDSAQFAIGMHKLATIQVAERNFEPAAETLRITLEKSEKKFGKQSLRYRSSLTNYGIALRGRADLKGSESALQQALDLFEEVEDFESTEYFYARINFAATLLAQGKVDEVHRENLAVLLVTGKSLPYVGQEYVLSEKLEGEICEKRGDLKSAEHFYKHATEGLQMLSSRGGFYDEALADSIECYLRIARVNGSRIEQLTELERQLGELLSVARRQDEKRK